MTQTTTNAEEVLELLASGVVSGKSAMSMRSETKQTKLKVKFFPRLEKKRLARKRLLLKAEIAVNFNTDTGMQDELFNDNNKDRPLVSATLATLHFKRKAAANEAVKKEFMRRANVKEWDLSDLTSINDEDKKVIRPYRVPQIFTLPTLRINDERVTGSPFGKNYLFDVRRDEKTGEIIGEYDRETDTVVKGMPAILKINKLQRECAYVEIKHIDEVINAAKKGKHIPWETNIGFFKSHTDPADISDKDLKKHKGEVWDKVVVGEDVPSNFVLFVEFDLENNLKLKDAEKIEALNAEELEGRYRIAQVSRKMKEVFDGFKNGTHELSDLNYDYFEIDMVCPSEMDDETDAAELGQKTTFGMPARGQALYEQAFWPDMQAQLAEVVLKMQDVEERAYKSSGVRPLTEEVVGQVINVLSKGNFLDKEKNPWLTESIIKSNTEALNMLYGDAAEELIADLEEGLEEGRKTDSVDAEEARKEAREFNVNAILNQEDGGESVYEGADDADVPVEDPKAEATQEAGVAEGSERKVATIELE